VGPTNPGLGPTIKSPTFPQGKPGPGLSAENFRWPILESAKRWALWAGPAGTPFQCGTDDYLGPPALFVARFDWERRGRNAPAGPRRAGRHGGPDAFHLRAGPRPGVNLEGRPIRPAPQRAGAFAERALFRPPIVHGPAPTQAKASQGLLGRGTGVRALAGAENFLKGGFSDRTLNFPTQPKTGRGGGLPIDGTFLIFLPGRNFADPRPPKKRGPLVCHSIGTRRQKPRGGALWGPRGAQSPRKRPG